MFKGIQHTGFITKNIDKCYEFYSKLPGIKVVFPLHIEDSYVIKKLSGYQNARIKNFYIQVGDGGSANGGSDTIPVITNIDIVGPGTIFNESNTGQTNTFTSDLLWAISTTTDASVAGQLVADGLLAYVTFDTTGTILGESWSLMLTGVATGIFGDPGVDTSFAGVPANITNGTISIVKNPEVVGRHIFYNNSSWDGRDPITNASDDAAIATDKSALLPGQKATFANYTSYSRGINGIMVDIDGLDTTPIAGDFVFRIGNNNDPGSWGLAPAPEHIEVRSGAGVPVPGVGGAASDRVTITWVDNNLDDTVDPNEAVAKQWVQVTVLSNANGGSLGLAEDNVFYLGNAVGDTGNLASNTIVNAADEILARNNPAFFPPATITNLYDFNRDKTVGAADQIIARNNTTFADALKLITVPASPAGSSPAAAAGVPQAVGTGIQPVAAVSNLSEVSESFDVSDGDSNATATNAAFGLGNVGADTLMALDLLTVDIVPLTDASSGVSFAMAPTIVQRDAAMRYSVLGTPDLPEYGDDELEIDLLADLDPLTV